MAPVLAPVLIGSALSTAGAAFQGLFRNPLVSPDILGASSDAALGTVIGIYPSLPILGIELLSFGGGLAAVAAVYGIGAALRSGDAVLVLVLTSIVIGSLFGAGIGLVKYLADPYNQLPAMTFWLLGSLAGISLADLVPLAIPVVAGTACLLLLRWRMNVMSLPDEEARALGVAAGRDRRRRHAGDGRERRRVRDRRLGRAGGAAPRAVSRRAGLPRLLPTAALLGGTYLLLIDTAARTIASVEIPLGILTAVIAVLHRAARPDPRQLDVILEGRNLSVGYRNRRLGENLAVGLEAGQALALLGPNGSGKTTLLKTLLGLIPPLAGDVRLDGIELASVSVRDRARHIAYVPQVHSGTFGFSVADVVLMGRTAY